MKEKKIALVELMGGLGNQLHQLVFAKYLEKNDFNVYVSEKWYNSKSFVDGTTKREVEVNLIDFGLKKVNNKLHLKFQTLDKVLRNPFSRKFYNSNSNKIYRFYSGDDFNKQSFHKYSWFKGYWQNRDYLTIDKAEVIKFLKKNINFKLENNYSSNTLVHIRKSDYISWGEDLPNDYYLKSLKILSDRNLLTNYDIFTDDLNIDRNNDLYMNCNNLIYNPDENPIKVLSKMMSYKNFIIANSSLSFFAAFLGSDKSSIITYPEPWFKSISHKTYRESNWIAVNYLD